MMDDKNQAELNAWRFAFDHLGDGTPDGAAQAINEQIDSLKRECEQWKRTAYSLARIASVGNVYEITK